jgi:NhaA family Na+:H+ antiporter
MIKSRISVLTRNSNRLFREFLATEQSGGIILVVCTVAAMLFANSSMRDLYFNLLHWNVFGLHVEEWINDGLMTIFFVLVGLELEREIYHGELRTWRKALLPVVAAIGGMVVPAGIYLLFNSGTEFQRGAGIPTATDIAFSLALLSVVANRVPFELKVFLTAIAIADDLGAVLLIALAYSNSISIIYLMLAACLFALLCIANRMGVDSIWFFSILGIGLWVLMLHSGIHATITGILFSFALPFRDGGHDSPSYKLQHRLHFPVAFGVLPIFAFANTGIAIPPNWLNDLLSPSSLGIALGLCFGKPIGILLACFLLVATGFSNLPTGLTARHVVGAAIAAGIGFTMSIFVTNLAFEDHGTIDSCKISILLSLLTTTLMGLLWFHLFVPILNSKEEIQNGDFEIEESEESDNLASM